MVQLEIVEADLARAEHRSAVLEMVDAYARDPMGDGRPLAPGVRDALVPALRAHPTTLIFLAYSGGEPIGVAVCFLGFSTFAARRLINIHDLSVLPAYRGRGVGRRLLEAIERKGRELDCCKLTLEVYDENHRARRAYEAAGFAWSRSVAGNALFMAKPID